MTAKGQHSDALKTPFWTISTILGILVYFLAPICALLWLVVASAEQRWISYAVFTGVTVVRTSAVRKAATNERVAVFLFGQPFKIVGPGTYVAFPLLARVIKINLDEKIPEWRDLDEEKVNKQIWTIAAGVFYGATQD